MASHQYITDPFEEVSYDKSKIIESKQVTEYVEAAVHASNNGYGAQYYVAERRNGLYKSDIADKIKKIPKEQLVYNDDNLAGGTRNIKSYADFNQKSQIVAVEYMRLGWVCERTYEVYEPYRTGDGGIEYKPRTYMMLSRKTG